MNDHSVRAGDYVDQLEGYRAFIPKALPPNPKVILDYELADLLSKANRGLGRLDGSAEILPNPDLFVAMYVRKEAVISSQIEGTQATLEDMLKFEAVPKRIGRPFDVSEVVNHVHAMNYGIGQVHKIPIGSKLIKELHKILMEGVRGKDKSPGEFRQTQNWIGPPGSGLKTATFVPPPPGQIAQAMADLDRYIEGYSNMPLLIKCGLVHAQFETIHPFLDGNGRLGRLLVTLLLCKQQILKRPLLYLSAYYKQNRDEYYSLLQRVREKGDWESWLKFFLKGIWLVSEEAFETTRKIITMRENHRQQILESAKNPTKCLLLLDHLFQEPMIETNSVKQIFNTTYPSARKIIGELIELQLLREKTGQKRNQLFSYAPYVDLLRRDTEEVLESFEDDT